MKSLEIVNEALLENGDEHIGGEDWWLFNESDLQQIKQDLEVLEIFKALIFHNIKSIGFNSSIKSYEALFNMGIITQEQLDKLKRWLEENE